MKPVNSVGLILCAACTLLAGRLAAAGQADDPEQVETVFELKSCALVPSSATVSPDGNRIGFKLTDNRFCIDGNPGPRFDDVKAE